MTCADTSIDIVATPTVQGAATYLWSTGETTSSITVITAGIYNVTVTDSDNGCTVTSLDVTIEEDILAPTVTVIPDATELTCADTSIDIVATPTVQGAATYLWSTGETTSSITVTTAGIYNVTVTDSDNGCTVTSLDVTIEEDILAPTVTVIPDATELTCADTSIDIVATPTVQGAATYLWSTGETTSSITVTTAGIYNVTVTDSDNGCTVTSVDVTIEEDILAPTVTVIPDATELTCADTSIDIVATPTVQGAATYLWSTGETTSSITVTTAGIYNVTVTDSDNGCTVTSLDVTIEEDILAPTVTVIPDATELTCADTSIDIVATPTVQGAATYLWSTGETTSSITVTTAGIYNVTVTDSDNGCTVTSVDVTIEEDILAPTVTVIPDATELTCADTSIDIVATPTVQGAATYLWSTGETTSSITVTTAGIYNVVVTDSDNGCTVTSLDVTIEEDILAPTVTVIPDATELTCADTSIDIVATPTVQGAATYLWSTGETTSSITVTTAGNSVASGITVTVGAKMSSSIVTSNEVTVHPLSLSVTVTL